MSTKKLRWVMLASLAVVPALGQTVGPGFTYQGRLIQAGQPYNGNANLEFRLFDAAAGGAPVGLPVSLPGVPVVGGLFTVELNAAAEFGSTAFDGNARWLETTVNGTPLSPRQPLTPAPYAHYALKAANGHALDAVDGNPTNALFVDADGQVGIGTTSPEWKLQVVGGVHDGIKVAVADGTNTSAQVVLSAGLEPQYGQGAIFQLNAPSNTIDPSALFVLNRTSGPLVLGTGNQRCLDVTAGGNVGVGTTIPTARIHGKTDGLTVLNAVYGETSTPSGTGVLGESKLLTGDAVGVAGRCISDAGIGVVGLASAATGTTYGARFQSNSTGGRGVYGLASAYTGVTYGVWGRSESSDGLGVFGEAPAASGMTYGVWGESSSTDGCGAFGVARATTGRNHGGRFESYSNQGTGLTGWAAQTSGSTKGVFGQSDSTTGIGVEGYAAAWSGLNYGGYFSSNSPEGVAVYGTVSTGQTSVGVKGESGAQHGTGVLGVANNGSNAFGIWGQSTSGYAGFFDGNVDVVGTLSKSGGSFKIDHPLDPANKYLCHSFVESPDMLNIYNGNVVTDDRGYVTVELPEWFEALNRDFRYQLTVIDAADRDEWVFAKVVREIADRRFTIRTSRPQTKVSWQVTGVRQDAWAEANRIAVEQEKPAPERGYYLHPEVYRLGPDRGTVAAKQARAPRRPHAVTAAAAAATED